MQTEIILAKTSTQATIFASLLNLSQYDCSYLSPATLEFLHVGFNWVTLTSHKE